jgi:hypothetical protein
MVHSGDREISGCAPAAATRLADKASSLRKRGVASDAEAFERCAALHHRSA